MLLDMLHRLLTELRRIGPGHRREICTFYLFRCSRIIAGGNTVVAVAPLEQVVSVYEGGGARGLGGLSTAFGGAIEFRNEDTGQRYIGVWGQRNASRFRRKLRGTFRLSIVRQQPSARLVSRLTLRKRPQRPS